ncbi:Cobalt-precorrin-2 C(20)-methyltransferase [bioreactor metagenome]|uniref:Cobalt-precorrin-2 C(20)-methyltransferase n=1 Tax=bioreactor metagenome TaxID=1076179 RepID=A0A644ZMX6_9ZZZZ
MTKGTLYGVSVGPGDPSLMTLKAVACIQACGIVAAPRTSDGRSLALHIAAQEVDVSGKEIEYLDLLMTRDPERLARTYGAAADCIAAHLDAGRDVAALTLGDASLYSSFSYLSAILGPRGYEISVIPGVTSFCACAAALGQSLTDMNAPLHIIPAGAADLEAALALPGGKVVMKSGRSLPLVKQLLHRMGLARRAALVTDCGLPTQQVCPDIDRADGEGYFTTLLIRP